MCGGQGPQISSTHLEKQQHTTSANNNKNNTNLEDNSTLFSCSKWVRKKAYPRAYPLHSQFGCLLQTFPPSSPSSSHKHTHTLSYLCNGRRRRTFLGGKTTRGKISPSCGSPCTCCATVSSPRKTGEENPRATNLNSPTRTGFVLREPSRRERERE